MIIVIKIIPESFEAISFKAFNYIFDNFICRRLTDHNKITFAIKYLLMSYLGRLHHQSHDYC